MPGPGRRGGRVSVQNLTRGTCLGAAVRVADSGLRRIVGLLGRINLGPGEGLWIVPSQGVHTFGMLFPIDVVFLDGASRVVGLRPGLKPFWATRLVWKANSVLELPVETIRQTQTAVGDQCAIQPSP